MIDRIIVLLEKELSSLNNSLTSGALKDWDAYLRVSSEARAFRRAIDIAKKVEFEGDREEDDS